MITFRRILATRRFALACCGANVWLATIAVDTGLGPWAIFHAALSGLMAGYVWGRTARG